MCRTPFPSLALCLVSCLIAACAPSDPPDLILHHGVVWTGDEAHPRAEAVAVRDGRILAVGGNDLTDLAGPGTRLLDLEGGLAVPGFYDTHVHFASAARFLEFNIMHTTTQEAFEARLDETVAHLAAGEWILGGFWGAYDDWTEGSAGGERREPSRPDIRRVEALTAAHPLFIRRFDNTVFAANRAALMAAGLDPQDPEAPGVVFERDAEGHPTGLMTGREGVEALFRSVVPGSFSDQRRLAQTRHALAVIRENGVTSISDMSDDAQLALYRRLHRDGELTVRVHFRYPLDRWLELADQGIRVGSGDPWIRLGALKGHIDGIMGTSTARFFQPYENDPTNYGRWRRLMVDEEGHFVEGQFLQYLLDADRAGLQLSVHAIGDEANSLLMDYLETLTARNGPRDRRFRLVHAQVIAPDDFARMGPLGIIAEVQPFHLSDDMRWMEERIGQERSRGAYAFRRIRDSGATLIFGSDWPGTSAAEYPINPMLGLYAAVTRQTVTGQPPEGWFPDERLPLEDALRAYTANAAYASFEEDLKGRLIPGFLADITVLDRNLFDIPPADYLTTRVRYTIVDGLVVYEAP